MAIDDVAGEGCIMY